MSWPDEQAYNEAIQNPHTCFSDNELRSGQIATQKMGLPKVMSGNSATVYQINCNQRTWAVRCFRREIKDQQLRYAAVSVHLKRTNLPYVVGFEFLPQGIKVNNKWYPILKMEWVNGQTLDQFIKENISNQNALLRLTREWLIMINALNQAQIAHGDLQNGNVLVVGGRLKLIDYDGMYVPALAGRPSTEQGHPDFQHPLRSNTDFGLHLDAFSAWVVFASLLALIETPHLWEMLQAGGDRLLLGREDFANPDKSFAFSLFRESGSPSLEKLANELITNLRIMPQSIKPPDNKYTPVLNEMFEKRRFPDWMSAKIENTNASSQASIPSTRLTNHGSDWLLDHIEDSLPLPVVQFCGWFLLERLLLGTGFLFVTANAFGLLSEVFLPNSSLFIFVLFSILTLVFFHKRYKKTIVVREKKALKKSVKITAIEERGLEKQIKQINKKNSLHESEFKELLSAIQSRILKRKEQLNFELSVIQKEQSLELTKINNQKRTLVQKRDADTSNIEGRNSSKIRSLMDEISKLPGLENSEKARILTNVQKAYIDSKLQRNDIATEHFRGIGTELKQRLQEAGVLSALDVTVSNVSGVYGIGNQRMRTLLDWRISIEKRARASMPIQIPTEDEQRIRNAFALRSKSLSSALDNERQQLTNSKTSINRQFEIDVKRIDQEISEAQTRHRRQTAELNMRFDADEKGMQSELAKTTNTYSLIKASIDKECKELQKSLFRLRLSSVHQKRKLDRFERVTLVRYIGRVLGIK